MSVSANKTGPAKVYNKGRVPIKAWLPDMEHNALEQAINVSNLPFVVDHVAIMPDAHSGYGVPIGGVIATDGVVIPNAVGSDIGCGMCAVDTGLSDIDALKTIVSEIRKAIPVGYRWQENSQPANLMPKSTGGKVAEREYDNARRQLGTLGSGNHFIEIQRGDNGHIWVMIHSGSRQLGKLTADHYIEVANEINKRDGYPIHPSWDLCGLRVDSKEGKEYMQEMNYCLEFAKANRDVMMDRALAIIKKHTKMKHPVNRINIHHNYAQVEEHFGKTVVVHRKGATSAQEGEMGIIPGSQGTHSYICRGLGNPDSFNSCSHGAGRKMSRSKARKKLNLEDEQAKLESQGILHAIKTQKDLDEASGAYKDISTVLANESDLVEPVIELSPLAVIKG